MKFRARWGSQLVPQWELHYIPYQQLKASLKKSRYHHDEPSKVFYAEFATAIEANIVFSQQLHYKLQYDEELIEKHFSQNNLPGNHHTFILELGTKHLLEIRSELVSFCRANYEAIVRMCSKITRFWQPLSAKQEDCLFSVRRQVDVYLNVYTMCVEYLESFRARSATRYPNKPVTQVDVQSLDRDAEKSATVLRTIYKASISRDTYCQTPLHFAAIHGMLNVAKHEVTEADSADISALSPDRNDFTPLHLATAYDQVGITRYLLSAMKKSTAHGTIPDNLLHIALRRQHDDMIHLLLSEGVGLTHVSSAGKTSLYVAAEVGRDDYLRLLLSKVDFDFINTPEDACQWTPLMVACIQGHVSTAKLLLNAGADAARIDYLGWDAQEHAAFRGHLPVAELFSSVRTRPPSSSIETSIGSRPVNIPRVETRPALTHLVVNLGGLQNRNISQSTTLNLPTTLGHGYILSISALDSSTLIERMLPLHDDAVDDTFIFTIEHETKAQLTFQIRKKGFKDNEPEGLIGTGVAVLSVRGVCLGNQHSTLLREEMIPILERTTSKLLGTLSFSFLIVKPFGKLHSLTSSVKNLRDSSSVQLVGHRGFGQNSRKRFLQLGENTIGSILAAEKQGAQFVEFDVQLTKDFVPVLFHDFSLSESGTDVPVHDVTLSQFLHASNIQSPRGDPPSISSEIDFRQAFGRTHRPRSRSVTTTHEQGAREIQNRMKYTVDYSIKGFKPNTRGDFIQDTFATLEDVLRNAPSHVGFDMEIKYPRLHEALEAGVAPIAIDINIFVDTILDVIARFGGTRNIMLSSFTPEICILLALKQRAYPVLFITNAGKRPLSDREKRAASLQVALRFAKFWGLAGIVVAADSLVLCPRLIQHVKDQGLVVGSYNDLNNDPKHVETQVNAGIDLLVADRVGLVRRTLDGLGV